MCDEFDIKRDIREDGPNDEDLACVKKWEPTKLLEGIPEDEKYIVACMLENQRLYNQMHDNAQFKRLSIPIVRRIAGALVKEGYKASKTESYDGQKVRLDSINMGYYSSAELNHKTCGITFEADLCIVVSEELTKEISERFKPDEIVLHELHISPVVLDNETFNPTSAIILHYSEVEDV